MTFADRFGPWALVLGASEGLGRALALDVARRGCHVVLVARREDRLAATADEVRALGREARAVSLDLAAPDLTDRLRAITRDLDVGLVVYDACHSVVAPFLDLTEAQVQATLDVNARGPALAAHALLPGLAARGRGGFLIVSSLSAFQGSALVGHYAATKAFDLILGETLWEELGPRNMSVLMAVAGATLTPNFEAATPEARRASVFPMRADAVAAEALDALDAGRGPTWIVGRTNRAAHAVLSLLPRAWAVRFISGQTRRTYGDAS